MTARSAFRIVSTFPPGARLRKGRSGGTSRQHETDSARARPGRDQGPLPAQIRSGERILVRSLQRMQSDSTGLHVSGDDDLAADSLVQVGDRGFEAERRSPAGGYAGSTAPASLRRSPRERGPTVEVPGLHRAFALDRDRSQRSWSVSRSPGGSAATGRPTWAASSRCRPWSFFRPRFPRTEGAMLSSTAIDPQPA